MPKYQAGQGVVSINDDGNAEHGVIKEYLGDNDGEWYLVRVNGLDEEWHESIFTTEVAHER